MKRVSKIGKCIGDFYSITNTKWRCHNVIALEESKLIYIPLEAIDRKIKVTYRAGNG